MVTNKLYVGNLSFSTTAEAVETLFAAIGEVREEELSRLDRLAERVRADTSKNDMDRARQLKTIERLRGQIQNDS